MAHIIKRKNGSDIVLRNPAEKSKRFARQLKNGCVTETGEALSDEEKAYRRGYLNARNDNAKAYKSNKKKLKH